MKKDWTPTPWQIGADQSDRYNIYSGFRIATTQPGGEVTRNNANAKRIVASVNATSALSTESLEAGVVDKLLRFLEYLAVYKISEPAFAAQNLLDEMGVE